MKRTLLIALAWATVGLVPAHAQQAAPSDPQIAAIVVTANQVDIDAGRLARDKARSKEVRQFAEQMTTDHASVNKSASELVRKLKVTPQPNATSESLKKDGDAHLAKLKGLSGAEFDRTYVDREVAYHQQVLDALDQTLVPSASNPELKALLVKTRPAFAAHLEHARQLQANLAK